MDEKPVGTPNPLNPMTPIRPTSVEAENNHPVSRPINRPAPRPANRLVTQRPTIQNSAQTQPKIKKVARKRRKSPLFIVAIILFLISVGLAVAAVLILNPFSSHDAVPAAISKLFSGDLPQNVTMKGNIANYNNNDDLNLSIDFSSKINNKTGENVAAATITANLPDYDNFTFKADEIHTLKGDLYLKLDGIYGALNNLDKKDSKEISVLDFLDIFDVIDNEWIYIPNSDFSNLNDVMPGDGITKCLTTAAGNLGEYGENFMSLYNKNPFIEYSTANLDINKKKDPLYRLSFNAEKLAAFSNSIGNSGFSNELLACTGNLATKNNITVEEMTKVIDAIPAIYVEIDDKDNFTRLYMVIFNTNDSSKTIVDVSFSYPESSIIAEAPKDYINLGDLLEQLLSKFYGADIVSH